MGQRRRPIGDCSPVLFLKSGLINCFSRFDPLAALVGALLYCSGIDGGRWYLRENAGPWHTTTSQTLTHRAAAVLLLSSRGSGSSCTLDRGGQGILVVIGDGGRPEGLTRMWEGTRTTTQQDPTGDGIQARGDGRARVRIKASVV